MKTLGLRHAALNVKDAQASKKFYTSFFGMTVEWEPDPANVYLTSAGQDNLALHENKKIRVDSENQTLDHLGFIMASKESVDELYQEALRKKIPIFREVKQHRDGAYSFYLKDPDGIIVQVIYHPSIALTSQSFSQRLTSLWLAFVSFNILRHRHALARFIPRLFHQKHKHPDPNLKTAVCLLFRD